MSGRAHEAGALHQDIGAVNTVASRNGRLIGYNTDSEGYLRSLVDETGLELAGQRVLILGAGGAARAVAHALAVAGVESITIANRTREKAERRAVQRAERRQQLLDQGIEVCGDPARFALELDLRWLGELNRHRTV